ncbi:hypothetical protein F0L68_17025 [Solihabitans fulvus]|uniref:Uncharacterized protein n=1 Tax=Solihabitans fulvus TaxID=1892852 RepID=A0A5B2XFA1_9PSEU|nr:hypothetical protein [Solihabitans fulvus]KAA2261482.1 hypothetical protein F0L68_17025 [Solihabitans fulvus]
MVARADALRASAKLAALGRGMTFGANGNVEPGTSDRQRRWVAGYRNVVHHADSAERCVTHRSPSLLGWLRGSSVETAFAHIHEGEVQLIELLPEDQLTGHLAEVRSTVQAYLPPDDLRRLALEDWGSAAGTTAATSVPWSSLRVRPRPARVEDEHRELIATTLRAAYLYGDTEHARVRSFRNILLGAALAMGVLLIGLGLVGSRWPAAVSLCVPHAGAASGSGPQLICPTNVRYGLGNGPSGGDVFLVELMGLVGAALAGVRAISASRKVESSYSLAVAQATLKATAGATTAVIGVLLLSSGIVSSIGQLQSQAAILTYAVIFGYAQQLLTGLIDQRADAVLQAASPASPAKASTPQAPSGRG